MKENFWRTSTKNVGKSTTQNFMEKLENLKSTILHSSSEFNLKDIHGSFAALYKEAKTDAHKKMVCDSALDYCNEKWLFSSNSDIFSKYSPISKEINEIIIYWKSEKEQLNIPIRPFSIKTNSQ